MDENLPLSPDYRQQRSQEEAVGGIWTVDGWDAVNILDEGLNEETDMHPSFSSGWEALEFVMGTGRYSDSNSFFYTPEDGHRASQEGFFNDFYCPQCVEDAVDVDIEEDIDPVIEPVVTEETRKSYKQGAEAKEVVSTWYQCSDHPEIYIKISDSEYI